MNDDLPSIRPALKPLTTVDEAFKPLGPWTPQQAKVREKLAKTLKELAEAIQDWEMLDQAVDQEISDQRNLVEWWRDNIQRAGRRR